MYGVLNNNGSAGKKCFYANIKSRYDRTNDWYTVRSTFLGDILRSFLMTDIPFCALEIFP